MSRTRRYVPHWVIEDELHPWIDPLTLAPYVYANPHRQVRMQQRHAARLRGDDGRISSRWRSRRRKNYHTHVRTQGKKLILEGYQDLLDQLDQEYEDQLDWYDDEPMDYPDWWYDPFADDTWPDWEDEPDEPDPIADRWEDDGYYYDPYEWDDCPSTYDYRHDDRPDYTRIAREQVNYDEPGETLGDILTRHLALRENQENNS